MNPPVDPLAAAPRALALPRPTSAADYLELTKPGLSGLSVMTTLAGYAATRPDFAAGRLLALVAGTALCAAGAAALNQFLEIDTDARMRRTRGRPLPAGRMATGTAFVLGVALAFSGAALLLAQVNGMAALFAGLTLVTYLGFYTPAKRTSRWSTEIGAVAGAFPPLIGWAAGTGGVEPLGWILFAVLFFWQIPHFMAIAWLHRDDYAVVEFPLLAVRDPGGRKVAGWSFANALLLVAVTLLPPALGHTTWLYGGVAGALGAVFLLQAWRFRRAERRIPAARQLFFGSIAYLPLLLAALVADRLLVR